MISLKKEYKTRDGKQVRALTAYRHEVKGTVNVLWMIKGQVHMEDALNQNRKNWVWQVWDEDGLHQFASAMKNGIHPLDLVEVKKLQVPHVTLFRDEFINRVS